MTEGSLAGLRVIDAATLAAGPLIATWMGEHGAEVIKVEQPDGIGLMGKSVARNKKCVTLNLHRDPGAYLDGMLVDAAHLRHAATVADRAALLGRSGKGVPG